MLRCPSCVNFGYTSAVALFSFAGCLCLHKIKKKERLAKLTNIFRRNQECSVAVVLLLYF